MSTKRKFQLRAHATFQRSVDEVNGAVTAMLAEHAAKGLLKSGATIKAAIRNFEHYSGGALAQVLSEAAKLIDHRGRKWRAAMAGIRSALDDHLANARALLQPTIHKADPMSTPSISAAVDERLEDVATRLRKQLAEFDEGWTAPVPKPWRERNAFLYATLLLLVGALAGLAAPIAKRLLGI